MQLQEYHLKSVQIFSYSVWDDFKTKETNGIWKDEKKVALTR